MRNRVNALTAALAAAFLLLLPVAVAQAGEPSAENEEISLIGQLTIDEVGNYLLIEEESGDSISLEGSTDLAAHVGTKVEVTGKWAEDTAGNKYLEVSRVKGVEA